MKRSASIVMAIIFMLTAASFATAGNKCGSADEMMVSPLDPEVKTEVQKLTLKYKLDTIDLKAEQMKLHEQMAEELMKDEPSSKALEKIYQDMSAVRAKLHKITVAHLLAVKKVLPKDHWAAYLKKHHGAGCGGMSGGCMKGGETMMKGCCQHGASCAKGGCCMHGGDGCAMKTSAKSKGCAGAKGASGCATPCVKIKK